MILTSTSTPKHPALKFENFFPLIQNVLQKIKCIFAA